MEIRINDNLKTLSFAIKKNSKIAQNNFKEYKIVKKK